MITHMHTPHSGEETLGRVNRESKFIWRNLGRLMTFHQLVSRNVLGMGWRKEALQTEEAAEENVYKKNMSLSGCECIGFWCQCTGGV